MRLRLRFTKEGKVRFTSHRDVARILERMARRAELPLAYSQGFSPRPRMHFGLALPTGCASAGEYMDIDLERPVEIASLPEHLSAFLPLGIDITAAAVVERGGPSLQEAITSCDWTIELPEVAADEAVGRADEGLRAAELVVARQRKGQHVVDDIRPGILALHATPADTGGSVLHAELATRPKGVRPGDLVLALDAGWEPTCIRRVHQWIASGDARHEPLATQVDAPPHAQVRAS